MLGQTGNDVGELTSRTPRYARVTNATAQDSQANGDDLEIQRRKNQSWGIKVMKRIGLKIMGMDFPGTVEHGQIQIGT